MIETKNDLNIKKTVEDFCKGKYVVDLHLFPYCIKIEKELSINEKNIYYRYQFTVIFPKKDSKTIFEISKTGSCGFDEVCSVKDIEKIIKLYEDSMKFLRDMALLQKKIEKEGIK